MDAIHGGGISCIIWEISMPMESHTAEHPFTPSFGLCPCGGVINVRLVEVNMKSGTRQPIHVDGVTEGTCPVCGSRVYRARTLALLEELYRLSVLPESVSAAGSNEENAAEG